MKHKQSHFEKLKQTLTDVIQQWITSTANDNDIGWIGDNLAALMSDAAFAVLAGSVDVQLYLEKEGQLS